MNRMLISVGIVAATTVSVHGIAGLPGVVAAASLATVLVMQSEAVGRIVRQSRQSCAAAATRAYQSVKAALAHPYVKRVARNAAFALLTSLATMLGEYVAGHVAGVIGAFITGTLVVSAGQSFPPRSSRG